MCDINYDDDQILTESILLQFWFSLYLHASQFQ